MTFKQLLSVIRKRRLLILATAAAFAVLAAAVALVTPASYSATTQMFVSVGGKPKDANDLNAGGTFSQDRVKSYIELSTSPRVLEPVITSLGLDTTPAKLATKISVNNPLDTVLMNVTVSAPTAEGAADIANGIASQMPKVVQEAEAPNAATDASPVNVFVSKAASAPADANGPGTLLVVAFGLLLGLLAGVAAALFREYNDTTISERRPPQRVVKAPVIAKLAVGHQGTRELLIKHQETSTGSDAFRYLRTNLRFLSGNAPIRSLVMTSAAGEEHTAAVAANTAIATAQAGTKVALVDADLRSAELSTLLRLETAPGLTTVLGGDGELYDQLIPLDSGRALMFLAAGPRAADASDLLASPQMETVIQSLVERDYYVIVNAPELTVPDAALLAKLTDGAVIVSRMGKTKVEQLALAANNLRVVDAATIGVVLTNVPASSSILIENDDEALAAHGRGPFRPTEGSAGQAQGRSGSDRPLFVPF